MKKESEDKLYRYEEVHYSAGVDEFDNPLPGGVVIVELREYPILARTAKGAWISTSLWVSALFSDEKTRRERGERFVLLTARKRFASETREQALDDYRARKHRQIEILKARTRIAELALRAADSLELRLAY